MRLVTFDDGKVGNRERSMQAGAILPPPTVATAASAATVAVGGSVTDVATLTGSSGAVTESIVFFVCGPSAPAPSCASGHVARLRGERRWPRHLAGVRADAAGASCFRAEYVPSASTPYSTAVHTNLTTECFTATAEPDVSAVKAAEDPEVSAGQGAAFGIVVANTGTGMATGVTVNDPLPAGVNWGISPAVQGCSIVNGELRYALGSLPAGDSVTIRVAGATAPPHAASSRTLRPSARATKLRARAPTTPRRRPCGSTARTSPSARRPTTARPRPETPRGTRWW